MNSDDEWQDLLRRIHDSDKARRLADDASQATPEPAVTAESLLRSCRAYDFVRQVQKTLLNGGGKLQFFEKVGGDEPLVRGIT